MRQTRQTFVKDFSFSIYWIHPANRISFNECICRHAVQSRFGSKDYAAGHEQQTTTTYYSLFLMLKLAVFLDLEDQNLVPSSIKNIPNHSLNTHEQLSLYYQAKL
ncbi:uncharacterized protein EAF02_002354 [Botrytis sinoallii]|uniref:uncharacterized protein n=1 Tax=Botrytis sinoallii TaxID=1463999 RepID=UPI001900CCD3|nr:uncharacterized protein EAF02_002354 [Botrytis sinoallii]KAF7889939.1 hypothetical protein EAF02_002354 [Botrytis sinoallii]